MLPKLDMNKVYQEWNDYCKKIYDIEVDCNNDDTGIFNRLTMIENALMGLLLWYGYYLDDSTINNYYSKKCEIAYAVLKKNEYDMTRIMES